MEQEVALEILTAGHPHANFGEGMPFEAKTSTVHSFGHKESFKYSARSLVATGGKVINYVYVGHVDSNPTFRGQDTGQGRRLYSQMADVLLETCPSLDAIIGYIQSPVALHLRHSVLGSRGFDTYVLDLSIHQPVRVKDVLANSALSDDSGLQVMKEYMDPGLYPNAARFPSLIGFRVASVLTRD